MFVESGLYEHLFKTSLNPKRVGPDHGEKIVYRNNDFVNLNIGQLHGIFKTIIGFEIISIFIYFYERYGITTKNGLAMIIIRLKRLKSNINRAIIYTLAKAIPIKSNHISISQNTVIIIMNQKINCVEPGNNVEKYKRKMTI